MIKEEAWPYPVYDDVEVKVEAASFSAAGSEGVLGVRQRSGKWVVEGGELAEYSDASIKLSIRCVTKTGDVAGHVFELDGEGMNIGFGYKIICEQSHFRKFVEGNPGEITEIELELKDIRDVLIIEPLFTLRDEKVRVNGLDVKRGAVLGVSESPVFLQIDQRLIGENLTVKWCDFSKEAVTEKQKKALVHVSLQQSGGIPEVWINEKFKNELSILNEKGGESDGIAGDAMRQWFWLMVWEKVLVWAIKNEDEEDDAVPATRIAKDWRQRFDENNWGDLPEPEDLQDADQLDALSMKIQHLLETGKKLSRIDRIRGFTNNA